MTETTYKRHQVHTFNKRLNNIIWYPVNQHERLTLLISDMKEVYDIPDGYDHEFEESNREVMELYRMAEVAREEVV